VDSVDNAVTVRPTTPLDQVNQPALNTRKGVDDDQAPRSGTERDYPQLRGSDLARAALNAAKEASGGPSAARNKQVKRTFTGGSRRRRRWSGPKPDDRDPQPLGRLASRIATERGWTGRLTSGQLFGRWAAIVAWATQLRLLQRQLLAKIAKGVGDGVVKRLKVHGPSTPSWRYGPRHVRGRGPRDTYG
jgi:predicted nucleic acid-binding Zn ribbon protein